MLVLLYYDNKYGIRTSKPSVAVACLYIYISIQSLGQFGQERYGSGTLHPGQVLRGSLPLLYCRALVYTALNIRVHSICYEGLCSADAVS